ncbi:MAG: Hpt domain-containing protein [Planctomycetota bacterium]
MSHPASDPDATPSNTPLVSTLSSDPDMAELVQFFVEEIDERITTIQTASQANDIIGLRTVAHQLKGAGTGYGFEPISQTAGELERLIDETEALEVTSDIQRQVDELIDLCRRASA